MIIFIKSGAFSLKYILKHSNPGRNLDVLSLFRSQTLYFKLCKEINSKKKCQSWQKSEGVIFNSSKTLLYGFNKYYMEVDQGNIIRN